LKKENEEKQAKADRKAARKQAKIEEQKRQEQAQAAEEANFARKQRRQARKDEHKKLVQTLIASQDALKANNEATVTYLAKLDKKAELNMPNVSVQARLQKTLKDSEELESGKKSAQKIPDAEDTLEKLMKLAEMFSQNKYKKK